MDVLALILAILAGLVFLADANDGRRGVARTAVYLPLGLALLTASLICQFTTITDHLVG